MTAIDDPERLGLLMTVADQTRNRIDQHDSGNPCLVHVVLTDRRTDRQPWVEIRCVHGLDDEFLESIETQWPDVEFEVIYCDEEDL